MSVWNATMGIKRPPQEYTQCKMNTNKKQKKPPRSMVRTNVRGNNEVAKCTQEQSTEN